MSVMSISGLASGLDTDTIVSQLMAIERQPRVQLDRKQSQIDARSSLLKSFQTQLKAVQTAAADLRSVTLYAQTQAVESSDPTKITASTASGAGVGGYQLQVSQLANSAQRTFTFASPSADGTITIDGHATNVRAGMTAQELATAINVDRDATVYAAAVSDGTIVFSSRSTGDTGGDPADATKPAASVIAVTDGTGTLTEQTSLARRGRDAQYTIDGRSFTARSNVVTDGIAGVTLTLKGVTTTSGPVTVTVGAPGANVDAIQRKLQAFVDAYNTALTSIRAKLDEKSVPDPRTQDDIRRGVPDPRTIAQINAGVLFGDTQLSGLLDDMRQAIYTPIAGMPAGMASLADLGISTGDATDRTSKETLAGMLTIDTDRLTRALTTDPLAVRQLLAGVDNAGGWARSFESIVDRATGTDGMLATRITGADDETHALRRQMDSMDARLAVKESSLRAQFAALEVAMARSQQQGQWLTGQLAALGN